MILTAQEFLDSGLPIASDITETEAAMSINTVEQFYMRPRIGDLKWADMVTNPTEYETAIEGGVTLAGLKQAEMHLVYAWCLYDRYRVTRYTTVVKNDEHSADPSKDEIMDVAKQHWEIGEVFVRELLKYLQIKDNGCRNNLIFDELLYPPTRSSHKQVR